MISFFQGNIIDKRTVYDLFGNKRSRVNNGRSEVIMFGTNCKVLSEIYDQIIFSEVI